MAAGRVRVGFVAPPDAAGVRRLEHLGAHSLWVGGHLASTNPSPEPLVWLARLVEQAATARVGTATLLLPLYPPALLAKQVADLDRASGGRLLLGVGVGGEYPADYAAVEVPPEERGARADEALGLLRRFWRAEPVEHVGCFHRFDGVRIHPAPYQPAGPPIVVSGRSDAAMRRAARLGDGWMPYLYSPARYASSVQRVTELAAEAGRDPAGFEWCAYLMVAVDDDGSRARQSARAFFGETYRQDLGERLDRIAVVGDVDEVGDRIRSFVEAGAEHLIVCSIDGEQERTAHVVLEEIAPGL